MANAIEEFFQKYVAAFNQSLGETPAFEEIQNSFAPCFVAAGPSGVVCGKNDEEFLATLEQGYDFYRKIGTQNMILKKVDVTSIDEGHHMAKVFYSSEYGKKGEEMTIIDFEVTYLLHDEEGRLQIFAYVAGDEREAFRKAGLLDG